MRSALACLTAVLLVVSAAGCGGSSQRDRNGSSAPAGASSMGSGPGNGSGLEQAVVNLLSFHRQSKVTARKTNVVERRSGGR